MKAVTRWFGIIVLSIGIFPSVQSQNYTTDLGKINLAYQQYTSLSMHVSYAIFPDWESNQALQREEGVIKKLGNRLHTQIGSLEAIKHENYSVVVDHADKTIVIMGIYGEVLPMDFNEIMSGIEKAVQYSEAVKHEFKHEREGHFEIVFPENTSEFQKVYLDYDTSTNLITKLTLFYAQAQDLMADIEDENPPRLEISYTNINTNPSFAEKIFTYEAFLQRRGQKLVCLDKYQQYEFVDHYSH